MVRPDKTLAGESISDFELIPSGGVIPSLFQYENTLPHPLHNLLGTVKILLSPSSMIVHGTRQGLKLTGG